MTTFITITVYDRTPDCSSLIIIKHRHDQFYRLGMKQLAWKTGNDLRLFPTDRILQVKI